MSGQQPAFTVGIEEEYLLVDRETRDVVSNPPREILAQCQAHNKKALVKPELMRSQIEVDRAIVKSGVQPPRSYPVNDPLLVHHP